MQERQGLGGRQGLPSPLQSCCRLGLRVASPPPPEAFSGHRAKVPLPAPMWKLLEGKSRFFNMMCVMGQVLMPRLPSGTQAVGPP